MSEREDSGVRRRSGAGVWRRRVAIGLAVLAVAALGATIGLAVAIVRYGAVDRARPADVIIVLGGGAVGTTRRAQHAAALYHQGYAPFLLCAGSRVPGEEVSEAERCAQVARQAGVPAGAIVLEETSRRTAENAAHAAAILEARGWRSAVLVSDDYHLWRARWLFEAEGVRAWPSPAQITSGSLPRGDKAYGVLREIAATGWHVGQWLFGLPASPPGL